jgi:hypothetical protein
MRGSSPHTTKKSAGELSMNIRISLSVLVIVAVVIFFFFYTETGRLLLAAMGFTKWW